MNWTVALAQIDSVVGDVTKNIKNHLEYIRKARDGGADLVVFPELSLTGYSIQDSNWDVALRVTDLKQLSPLLDESKNISILVGGVEESDTFGIHNSSFFFEKGAVVCVHRKIYPPTYGMFEELRYFGPGRSVKAFDTSFGRLGVLICEDLWHLPLPYILAQDGAQVIIGLAASPTRLSGDQGTTKIAQINGEQHKAYARLLGSYIVFCNRVGYEDGINFWGGSEVVAPNGEAIVQAKMFDEDIVFAVIDENEVRRARRFSRHFLDDDIHLVKRELTRISKSRLGN